MDPVGRAMVSTRGGPDPALETAWCRSVKRKAAHLRVFSFGAGRRGGCPFGPRRGHEERRGHLLLPAASTLSQNQLFVAHHRRAPASAISRVLARVLRREVFGTARASVARATWSALATCRSDLPSASMPRARRTSTAARGRSPTPWPLLLLLRGMGCGATALGAVTSRVGGVLFLHSALLLQQLECLQHIPDAAL